MPDGSSDFDAQLDALINGGGAEPVTQPVSPTPTQPAEAQKLKFGGREWDKVEDLGKAYEAMHKDYTRKSQDYAKLKPYGEFDAYLNKHPELRANLDKVVREYNARVNAGQSPEQAEKATGISPEMAERLERIESHFEEQQIQSEKDVLKSKYGVTDKEVMRSVIQKALELEERGISLSLEDVYKILSYDERTLVAKKQGEQAAQDKFKAKARANVGSSDVPQVSPSAKGVEEMSDSEYTKMLTSKLEGLGFSG